QLVSQQVTAIANPSPKLPFAQAQAPHTTPLLQASLARNTFSAKLTPSCVCPYQRSKPPSACPSIASLLARLEGRSACPANANTRCPSQPVPVYRLHLPANARARANRCQHRPAPTPTPTPKPTKCR
ncbi:unnamed protein product, partial [Dovyalis caffra]